MPRESAEDLDDHATFADFMGTELVPWVRKNWTVSTDPGQTILCGYSRGGLGAAFVALRGTRQYLAMSWRRAEPFGVAMKAGHGIPNG